MSGTVDLSRLITDDEVKALVTIETAERLAARAYRLLTDDAVDCMDGAAVVLGADTFRVVTDLLVALTTETTNRTCTAVKSQFLSDEISRTATSRVRRVLTEVER